VIARHAERADVQGRARGSRQGTSAPRVVIRAVTRKSPSRPVASRTIAYGLETLYLQGFSSMSQLPDGTYDVVVVDAEVDEGGDLRIEAAVTLGPHIGRIVRLRNMHVETRSRVLDTADPYSLLGIPGTLRVRDGVPSFRPETA